MFIVAFWTILNVYQSVIAEPIVVDRVIAVVNGEAILASELQTSLAIQNLTRAKGEPRDFSNTETNAVLEKMIDEKILLQRAKVLNMSVDSETIMRIIEDIAENQELTVDKLRKNLKKLIKR